MISPPQRPVHTFLLVSLTLGLYASVFMWRNARDLQRLDGKPTRPWLWALGPLIAISLPYLMGAMTDRYEALSLQRGFRIRNRGRLYGALALLAAIAAQLGFFVPEPLLVSMPLVLPSAALFALLGRDISQYKYALADREFSGPKGVLSSKQLVVILIGGLLSGSIYVVVLHDVLTHKGRTPLVVGERWHSPDGRFSIVPDDEWVIADIGTFSDGSAEVEFSLSSSVSVIVFDHALGEDMNAVADGRRSQVHETLSSARCREERHLRKGTQQLVSELFCAGGAAVRRHLVLSYQVDDGDQHLELYGQAVVSKLDEEEAREDLASFMRSVQLTRESAAP